jgi:hypothetical protein
MRSTVALLAALAVGGAIAWGPADGLTSTATAKPPGPKGKGPKGKDDLRKTYDALTEVSVWLKADRGRPPRDLTKLNEQARDLYRDALRAARDDDGPRARELALASHDAARGLLHALRANAPAAGLPAPPRRDDDELSDLLRRTRDRLEDASNAPARGPGRAFLDAARRFYDQARKADRDDDARALGLARAAEAWTHVGEHLNRADDTDARGPRRPRDRDDRPPPSPPDR